MPASTPAKSLEAVNKPSVSVSLEGIRQTHMDLTAVPWPPSSMYRHSSLGLALGLPPPISKGILNVMTETEVTHP